MATETRADDRQPGRRPEAGWKPYRLTVRQFLAMIDAGIFPHDAHVELLGGVLVQMMTKGDPHDYTLDALAEELRRLIPEGWLLREDKSLQLGPRSRPEPDIAIVRGPRAQYCHADAARQGDRLGRRGRRIVLRLRPRREVAGLRRGPDPDLLDRQPAETPGRGLHATRPAGARRPPTARLADLRGRAEVPVVIDGQEVGRIASGTSCPERSLPAMADPGSRRPSTALDDRDRLTVKPVRRDDRSTGRWRGLTPDVRICSAEGRWSSRMTKLRPAQTSPGLARSSLAPEARSCRPPGSSARRSRWSSGRYWRPEPDLAGHPGAERPLPRARRPGGADRTSAC